MKIGNRIHVEVPVEELEPGDYVFVLEGSCKGRKLRRVSKVVHGRKTMTVSLQEVRVGRCVLARARRVTADDILGAWRRRQAVETEEEVEEPEEPTQEACNG